ncbi:MAG: DUF4124 domain-containing protein [Xanthomonadales bacterium]|nr:DUF4124 domain-containing protein [Xanthomonadales bacterium]
MKLGITAGLFLMICISSQVSAEIYKWTNADGELVYSQTPPSDDSVAVVIKLAETSEDNLPEDQADKAVTEPEPAEAQTEADIAKRNCETVKANIAMLRMASPETEFASDEGEGEQITYTQAELNERIRNNQALVKTWCESQ